MNFYGVKKTMSDAEFNIIAKSDQIISNIDEIPNNGEIKNQSDVKNGIFTYNSSETYAKWEKYRNIVELLRWKPSFPF